MGVEERLSQGNKRDSCEGTILYLYCTNVNILAGML